MEYYPRGVGMSETEKITINLGLVDLGQVDLLVQEGFYSNRTDFIRTAIRNQLGTHAEAVRQTVARKTLVLGLQHYTRRDLEAVREAGEHRRRRGSRVGPRDHRLRDRARRPESQPGRKVGAEGPDSIPVKKGTHE